MTNVENVNSTLGSWSVHGPEDPQILVAGHSHALALLFALEGGNGPEALRGAVVLDTERRSSSFLDAEYWDLVENAATGRTIAIVWNGNQHNATFLLEAQPPFQVFRDGADTKGEDSWIPLELLRSFWNPSFLELRAVLPRLTSVAKVYLVGTPPPKPDKAIRSVISEDPFFIQQAEKVGMDLADLQITNEETRLAMWTLLQEMLEECASEAGAGFIAVPSDVADEHGMLLDSFSAPDATHANSDYGARLWSELAMAYGRDSKS